MAMRNAGIDRRYSSGFRERRQRLFMHVKRAFEETFPLPQPRIRDAADRLLEQGQGAVLFPLSKSSAGQLAERFRIAVRR
jgi:hypothetical protein